MTQAARPTFLDATRTGRARDEVESTVTAYRRFHSEQEGGDVSARRTSYASMINHYYDLVTDFYEQGWGQSFHFAPRFRDEALDASILRHEHWLALRLGLGEGQEVLDVGCGVGGPMRNIARFTGARITGINNNEYQIQRGREHTDKARLSGFCSFVHADFMQMPLPDARFDAAYTIEATCHAPDRVGVFSEIFRLLKPGGRFAGYEWCMTDRFDPKRPEHSRIKKEIEEGNAIPDLTHFSDVDEALRRAGFELEAGFDRADCGHVETPWYLPLTGRERSLRGLQRTPVGRRATAHLVRGLERLRIAPVGASEVSGVLNTAADGLVAGGELGIFTPMYFFSAKKP